MSVASLLQGSVRRGAGKGRLHEGIAHNVPHNRILLGGENGGKHRQRDNFASDPLCHREIARLMLQVGISFLQMKRQWIVDPRADASFR